MQRIQSKSVSSIFAFSSICTDSHTTTRSAKGNGILQSNNEIHTVKGTQSGCTGKGVENQD